ncbi:MAG TPA: aromatic ring-hydroxylating dioxygenase subunit alpha [Gaiellaceae bacterium]|nr:aromatic ring-hydroxylating dioxygenase subunit alpha [Gaiellaceae bacterium]
MKADLGAALAAGATLPADWYADPAIQRLEGEKIFARTWQYAGRADRVANPGDFFTTFAGQIPIVVVRDDEGVLRGFVNVCRHRGHLIAEGDGNRKALQCPYHAWTYDLDGSLRKAPRSEREPDFDAEGYSMLPVATAAWGPLVFVNPDPDTGPLADVLGPLPEKVAESGLDLDRLRFRVRNDWEIGCDWKIAIENYLECYHCSVAHPGFSKVIDVAPDEYTYDAEGPLLMQFAHLRDTQKRNGRPAYLDGDEVMTPQYHTLFPNFTFNIDPGPGNLSVDVTRPAGPGRCAGSTEYFFYEEVSDEVAGEMMAFANQVGAEDASLVASVQVGLSSGMIPHGRLLPSSEVLIQRFQKLVHDALSAD